MPKKSSDYDAGMGNQGREYKRPYDQGCGLMGVDWEERINFDRMRKERLAKAKGCTLRFSGPTFNEFVLRVKKKPADLLNGLLRKQIIGGLDLSRFYPELKDCILLCVTEQNSREEIDALAKGMGGGR